MIKAIAMGLGGAALGYIAYRLLRNWVNFRADDVVIVDGTTHSFNTLFDTAASAISLEGKHRALIRYTFLQGRRDLAAYQAKENIPIEASVAFFIAGSALGYEKSTKESGRTGDAALFKRIATQAQAYGEQFARNDNGA